MGIVGVTSKSKTVKPSTLLNYAARTTNSTLLSKEKATTRGRREERTEAEEEEDEEGEKAGGGSWFSPEQRLPLGGGRGLTSGWDGAGAAVIIHTFGRFWQLCPISAPPFHNDDSQELALVSRKRPPVRNSTNSTIHWPLAVAAAAKVGLEPSTPQPIPGWRGGRGAQSGLANRTWTSKGEIGIAGPWSATTCFLVPPLSRHPHDPQGNVALSHRPTQKRKGSHKGGRMAFVRLKFMAALETACSTVL
ncbi:hypothetical protein F5882DRAFT_484467 [Hyaloscypha sp. PMI_1271]|nr:hypothetical protein F5882DRAFT_484467 [Hyaloscypha sp. PMI_1271]